MKFFTKPTRTPQCPFTARTADNGWGFYTATLVTPSGRRISGEYRTQYYTFFPHTDGAQQEAYFLIGKFADVQAAVRQMDATPAAAELARLGRLADAWAEAREAVEVTEKRPPHAPKDVTERLGAAREAAQGVHDGIVKVIEAAVREFHAAMADPVAAAARADAARQQATAQIDEALSRAQSARDLAMA